jgi:hypothetical protein
MFGCGAAKGAGSPDTIARIVRCYVGKERMNARRLLGPLRSPISSTPHHAVAMPELDVQMAGLGAFCPNRNVFLS